MSSDTVVIGGGLVGAAVAYGLARQGERVAMLDEGDVAYRASRGNFGLVWVQSKGDGMPEYARWTRRSADIWPDFAAELTNETGVSPHYHKPGGIRPCLSESDLESQAAMIRRMHNIHGASYGAEALSAEQMREMLPGLGPDVVGGTWSPHDGHASPLYLLRGLHAGLKRRGGEYHAEARAQRIDRDGEGYVVETAAGRFHGAKVVLAAGLGNRPLGGMVGLTIPVKPQKGQILVSERSRQLLSMPTHVVRQSDEGTFMMGDSHEDAGFNTFSGSSVMADIARNAMRTFPFLRNLRVVRSWAALRVMSEDGFPIYQESETHPGVFSVNCHSGVTLAGAHAGLLAPMISAGRLDDDLSVFSARRFDAQAH